MGFKEVRSAFATALAVTLLSACGGGGGNNTTVTPASSSTITTGSGPCFFNTAANSMATFSGGWTWLDGSDPTGDVSVDYNIQDNSTACGGTGGTTKPAPIATYTLTWGLPVTGGYTADVTITVTSETGLPTVVEGYTDTSIAISTPDIQLGGGGNWIAKKCPLDITSVVPAPTDNRVIVSGTLECNSSADPDQLLTRPAPVPGVPETSVKLDKPITFTTVITLLSPA